MLGTTTTTTTASKRHTLPLHLLSGRAAGPDAGARPSTLTHRYAAMADDHAAFDDDDDDAIPLVPLTRVHSTWEEPTLPAPPPAYTAAREEDEGNGRASRPRRMYRYVSHGIGGAGNFRKVLTSLRADITSTDPSFARNAQTKGGASAGICACSRCFNKTTGGQNAGSSASRAGSSGSAARASSS